MTDNEIIKAKEHFQYGISHDIFKEPVLSYAKTVLWAFEEVNRQQAEIENLKAMTKAELDTIHKLGDDLEMMLENVEEQKVIIENQKAQMKRLQDIIKEIVDD